MQKDSVTIDDIITAFSNAFDLNFKSIQGVPISTRNNYLQTLFIEICLTNNINGPTIQKALQRKYTSFVYSAKRNLPKYNNDSYYIFLKNILIKYLKRYNQFIKYNN